MDLDYNYNYNSLEAIRTYEDKNSEGLKMYCNKI